MTSPSTLEARKRVALGDFRGYALALAIIVVCTLAAAFFQALPHTTAFLLLFPLAILVVTVRFGIGPAVVAAATGVLVFDYAFVPPAYELSLPDLENGLTLAVMLAVAGVASVLAERLRRSAALARQQAEVEQLRNALLSAMSHDLRTPLTTLVGAGAALCDDALAPAERKQFATLVREEAERLNRIVGNLLELTRLEAGRVRVKQELQAIDETIGAALVHLETRLEGHRVETDVPESIPLVPFDPILIEQVLINLIENVLRHASASPIEIAARLQGGEVVVSVGDRGPGVPSGAEEKVFEKLYRSPGHGDGGIGLGLTICRAIVAAHGGRIWLENREGGGAMVRFALPAARAPKVKE